MVCLILYTTYDLEFFETYERDERVRESTALRVLIWFFITYFIIMEIRQLIISGIRAYLRNAWNYMDLALYSSIVVAEILHSRFYVLYPYYFKTSEGDYSDEGYEERSRAVRTIYSFSVIIMWIRFLYFFRIFRTTGYYIRMLVQVVMDIRHFIFVFVLVILAFAHAWFVLLKNNAPDDSDKMFGNVSLAIAYVYKIALGDFDTDIFGKYYTEISWLFFVLATFLLQIVLINLLISIVADTFSNIKSNYNVIMYKDMLHMIIENRFLAVGPLTQALNHKYLLMALPISTSNEEEKDSRKPAIFRND